MAPPTPPAPPDPFAGKSEDDAVTALRGLEARLSVGEQLPEEDKRLLILALTGGATPLVRALAAAVLPWLDPAVSTPPLLQATVDVDGRVRTQAAQSLVALSRRVSEDAKRDVLSAALVLLDDPEDEAACAGAELAATISPATASEAIRARATKLPPVRYACFSRFAGLPQRRVRVPALPELARPAAPASPAAPDMTPPAEAPASSGEGTPLFVTTAVASGLLAGALVPAMFFPARDTLTYTPRTTRYGREEPSLLFTGTSALVGGAALGGAAYAMSLVLDPVAGPLDMAGASEVALGTAAGSLGGLGLGLMISLDDSLAAASIASGTVLGLGWSAASAYAFHPSRADVGLVAATSGLTMLAGTLTAFTVIPVGYELLFDRVQRTDFCFGAGMLAGGVAGLATTTLTPLVEMNAGRVVATSAGALMGASLGLAGGYLFTPVSLNVRSRVASGIGLGGQLIGGALVFFLMPDEWVEKFASTESPPTGALLAFDKSGLRFDVPMVAAIPGPAAMPEATALAIPLLDGRF